MAVRSEHGNDGDDQWAPKKHLGPHVTIVASDATAARGSRSSGSADLGARCADAGRVQRAIFSTLLLTSGAVALYDLYLLAWTLVAS